MEAIRSLNWGTYYFFNYLATTKLAWLRPVMEGVDVLGSYPAFGVMLAATVGILLAKKEYNPSGKVMLMAVFAVGLAEGLRFVLPSPRPPQHPANQLHPEEIFRSFPSRAAFLAVFGLLNLAMAMEFVLPRRRAFAFCGLALTLGLAVVVGQLILGLHFLNDVLAGLTGGIGLGLLCRTGKSSSDHR